jgi:hypothetical protein
MAEETKPEIGEELLDDDQDVHDPGVVDDMVEAQAQSPHLPVFAWTGVLLKGTAEIPLYLDLSLDGGELPPSIADALAEGEHFNIRVSGISAKHGKAVLRGNLLAAVLPSAQLKAGEAEITVYLGEQPLKLSTPYGVKEALSATVIEKARFHTAQTEERTADDTMDMRGNSLASLSLAEDHHQSFQLIDNGHEVAVLISKTDPSDFATIFVFGLKGGKARLDRYETAETNLDHRPKWDFVDTCQLGDVVVSSQGDLTIVQVADGVEFVFEPRTLKQAYSANLHVGPMVFAAITCVGEQWIQWFSKKWVPCVAMGDPEESGMIERFAAPTISSLTKRQRGDANAR